MQGQQRSRTTRGAGALAAGLLLATAPGAFGQGREATVRDFAAAAPRALAPQAPRRIDGYDVKVDLRAARDGAYDVHNSQVEARIAQGGAANFSIQTADGPLLAQSLDAAPPVDTAAVGERAVLIDGAAGNTVLRPTAQGVEAYVQTTQPGAHQVSWRVTASAAAVTLQAQPDGSVHAVNAAGLVSATFAAPVLDAAAGAGAAAGLTVANDVLTLTVDPGAGAGATAHFETSADTGMLVVTDYTEDDVLIQQTVDPRESRYLLSAASLSAGSARASAARSGPRIGARAADSSGDLKSTGKASKRTVMRARTQRTPFGGVAFRFKGVIWWHWKNRRILAVDVHPGWAMSDVNSFTIWKGIQFRDDGYYRYRWSKNRSGFKHIMQGRFDNCPPKLACTYYYPWVALFAHGDGTLHYSEKK